MALRGPNPRALKWKSGANKVPSTTDPQSRYSGSVWTQNPNKNQFKPVCSRFKNPGFIFEKQSWCQVLGFYKENTLFDLDLRFRCHLGKDSELQRFIVIHRKQIEKFSVRRHTCHIMLGVYEAAAVCVFQTVPWMCVLSPNKTNTIIPPSTPPPPPPSPIPHPQPALQLVLPQGPVSAMSIQVWEHTGSSSHTYQLWLLTSFFFLFFFTNNQTSEVGSNFHKQFSERMMFHVNTF